MFLARFHDKKTSDICLLSQKYVYLVTRKVWLCFDCLVGVLRSETESGTCSTCSNYVHVLKFWFELKLRQRHRVDKRKGVKQWGPKRRCSISSPSLRYKPLKVPRQPLRWKVFLKHHESCPRRNTESNLHKKYRMSSEYFYSFPLDAEFVHSFWLVLESPAWIGMAFSAKLLNVNPNRFSSL